jgi:hypothetical protein
VVLSLIYEPLFLYRYPFWGVLCSVVDIWTPVPSQISILGGSVVDLWTPVPVQISILRGSVVDLWTPVPVQISILRGSVVDLWTPVPVQISILRGSVVDLWTPVPVQISILRGSVVDLWTPVSVQIFFLVVLFGLYNGLVLLPVVLSLVGPRSNVFFCCLIMSDLVHIVGTKKKLGNTTFFLHTKVFFKN